MRHLEKTGPLILGFVILMVFGLLLPESDRHGMTCLAAVFLGLITGFEVIRNSRGRGFRFQLEISASTFVVLVFLLHIYGSFFLKRNVFSEIIRHGILFALTASMFAFLLAIIPVLLRNHRRWQRIVFYGVCFFSLLPFVFMGDNQSSLLFWLIVLLFGIRWKQVRELPLSLLALLVLIALIVGFTPFIGSKVNDAIFITPPSEAGFWAGRIASGLFGFLRIGIRLFSILFGVFGFYHWTAVILFGIGKVRAKLLGSYCLTALIPLTLFTMLMLFSLYLMISSYRSTLTKNMFHEQQVRFHHWVTSVSARPAFWDDLRPAGKGIQRMSLPQMELYPKALFDVLREVGLESDSIWVYTIVGTGDTVRIPKELREGGTTMGIQERDLCLYALLPTKGFVLRSWIPIRREFLLRLKDVAGTDITIYPRGSESTRHIFSTKLGSAGGTSVVIPTAGSDSTAEFDRLSTRETRRRFGIFDGELVAGINEIDGVDWQTGGPLQYTYILWLTPLRLWETIFNPEEEVNLGMRAAFYFLCIVFLAVMIAISWVGWRVAGGINRSARSLEKGVHELRAGHLEYTVPVVGGAEFRQVAESFNLLTADIRRMLRDLAEKERMEGELAIARTIQEKLLPTSLPRLPMIEMAARSIPARIVGGDYYDVIPLPDGCCLLALGDVSGKGIASALVMAKLHASLRTLALVPQPLPELMTKLNHAICQGATPGMFISLFIARLDTRRRCLEYVNGGHDFPILYQESRLESLTEGGVILGVFPDARYEQGIVEKLVRGRLVIYTDGFVETKDPEDVREFGVEALTEIIKTHDGGPEELLNVMYNEVEIYSEGNPAEDDRTAMVLMF